MDSLRNSYHIHSIIIFVYPWKLSTIGRNLLCWLNQLQVDPQCFCQSYYLAKLSAHLLFRTIPNLNSSEVFYSTPNTLAIVKWPWHCLLTIQSPFTLVITMPHSPYSPFSCLVYVDDHIFLAIVIVSGVGIWPNMSQSKLFLIPQKHEYKETLTFSSWHYCC